MKNLKAYIAQTTGFKADRILSWALSTFGAKNIAIASSFSAEDQALTHMVFRGDGRQSCRVFTLDTGRHFQETYDVWQKSEEAFKVRYEVCFPASVEVAKLISKEGPNLFYASIENRKACCAARKTNPLNKVLATVDAWIVGLRAEQAVTRSTLGPVEWDEVHGIYRISPLYNWTEEQVFTYVHENAVPISKLHERGFRSIGCAPCTRAIGPNDDVRAGRWWWEEPEHKECGLHDRPKRT